MGDRELPTGFGKTAETFLEELKDKLMAAQKYTSEHTQKSQDHYVHYHNLRSRLLSEKSVSFSDRIVRQVKLSADGVGLLKLWK